MSVVVGASSLGGLIHIPVKGGAHTNGDFFGYSYPHMSIFVHKRTMKGSNDVVLETFTFL